MSHARTAHLNHPARKPVGQQRKPLSFLGPIWRSKKYKILVAAHFTAICHIIFIRPSRVIQRRAWCWWCPRSYARPGGFIKMCARASILHGFVKLHLFGIMIWPQKCGYTANGDPFENLTLPWMLKQKKKKNKPPPREHKQRGKMEWKKCSTNYSRGRRRSAYTIPCTFIYIVHICAVLRVFRSIFC